MVIPSDSLLRTSTVRFIEVDMGTGPHACSTDPKFASASLLSYGLYRMQVSGSSPGLLCTSFLVCYAVW